MLQHVMRKVQPAQLEPCTAFYALLGFGPIPVPDTVDGTVLWLERGGTHIHLMADEAAAPGAGHIAVIADDYADAVDRLRAAGHTVEGRREHWGSPRALVSDPAGNLVELMEFPPGRSSSADTMRP